MTVKPKTKPRKRANTKISKRHSLLEAYLPAAQNSFGQFQRAWVVFTDEDRIVWLRWLRPGYRHCFVIINDNEHWLALEPLASCMEVTVLPSPPDFNLPEWLRAQGHQVVEAALQRSVMKTAPVAPLNCVEVCKRVLGVRAPLILTPYQLYRHLSLRLASARKSPSIGVHRINCDHGMFMPDEEINTRMHQAGFAPHQAQLVYDLAAERMVPMILEVANEYQAEREQERLVAEFGGRERWQELARQIQAWGSANMPAEALRGLSTTYDGIMALYRMMQDSGEQMPTRSEGASVNGADDLAAMMRDPRYWQKKDPNYVAKVTAAFERKYAQ